MWWYVRNAHKDVDILGARRAGSMGCRRYPCWMTRYALKLQGFLYSEFKAIQLSCFIKILHDDQHKQTISMETKGDSKT